LTARFPIGRRVVVGKVEKKIQVEDLPIDVGITSKWISNK
jgi:hypothetical protein